MIELIKACQSKKLVIVSWKSVGSQTVMGMLDRAGPGAARPDDLDDGLGLQDNNDYLLSYEQAQAILEMRLNRLTGLEQERLLEEYRQIIDTIAELMEILRNPEKLLQLIRDELVKVRDEYGDERRTEIVETQEDLTMEDLITEQDMVVTCPMVDMRKRSRWILIEPSGAVAEARQRVQ